MGLHLDTIPLSGIIRVRDLMFRLDRPYRLDQGDVSFDVPEPIKAAIRRALDENHTHYVQTGGLPRLRELVAEKLRGKNGIPVTDPEEVLITAGGMHALYTLSLAMLEPGDEVILPDPTWPATLSQILAAHAVPMPCPLREPLGWRFEIDELAARITPRTRAILINSPHNPTGGVLTRDDLDAIAALARRHDLWIIADEAYEDIVFDGAIHVSAASLPGMYARTVPVYTFSKSFAMTGLRLGYLAVRDASLRSRVLKLLSLTTSSVSSIVQHGAIGGLEANQGWIEAFRSELDARRNLFYAGIRSLGGILSGAPPRGAFYAFLKIDPAWTPPEGATPASLSWAFGEHVIQRTRVGCVPGVDFGPNGEGYVRFCFSRSREELQGALDALKALR